MARRRLLRLVTLTCLMWGGGALVRIASAQELTLGLVEIPRDLNFLVEPTVRGRSGKAAHLAASLIRDAVTDTLVSIPNREPLRIAGAETQGAREGAAEGSGGARVRGVTSAAAGSGFELAASDSVQVSADQQAWSFRLRRSAAFSSGEPVRAADVQYSLERCASQMKMAETWTFEVKSNEILPGSFEEWIIVRLAADQSDPHSILGIASSCPIVEKNSSGLFGDRLGEGSNIVAAGAYRIANFEAGKEFVLEQSRPGASFAKRISLRAMRDGTHALTALRTGTVDAIFFEDQEVLLKAASDQTLLTIECSGYKIVHRRGLSIECRQRVAELGAAQAPSLLAQAEPGLAASLEGAQEGGAATQTAHSRMPRHGGLTPSPAPVDLRRLRYLS